MNTIFLSSDYVIVKACEKACACAKNVQGAGTTCADVQIAYIICLTILIIALVAVILAFLWQWQVRYYKKRESENKHQWEVEEAERKKKSDLLDKYLDFLKSLSYPYDKDKEGKPVKKEYDKVQSDKYLKVLRQLMGIPVEERPDKPAQTA